MNSVNLKSNYLFSPQNISLIGEQVVTIKDGNSYIYEWNYLGAIVTQTNNPGFFNSSPFTSTNQSNIPLLFKISTETNGVIYSTTVLISMLQPEVNFSANYGGNLYFKVNIVDDSNICKIGVIQGKFSSLADIKQSSNYLMYEVPCNSESLSISVPYFGVPYSKLLFSYENSKFSNLSPNLFNQTIEQIVYFPTFYANFLNSTTDSVLISPKELIFNFTFEANIPNFQCSFDIRYFFPPLEFECTRFIEGVLPGFPENTELDIVITLANPLYYFKEEEIFHLVVPPCSLNCQNDGVCLNNTHGIAHCECPSGYYGSLCEYYSCYGIPSNSSLVCGQHGSCIKPDNCTCDEGYIGDSCSPEFYAHWNWTFYTAPGRFRHSATIDSNIPNFLFTRNYTIYDGTTVTLKRLPSTQNITNFFSPYSTLPYSTLPDTKTFPENAVVKMTFTLSNTIYRFIQVDNFQVVISPCNMSCLNNGYCLNNTHGITHCECQSGYSGSLCEYHSCYGIPSNSSSVCNQHGSCFKLDNCTCDEGFSGANCSTLLPSYSSTCFGISSLEDGLVCSGAGTCIGHDLCECQDGFYGAQCNISSCFGKREDDASVCSGRGTCQNNGKCSCQSRYGGLECEAKTCFGIPANDATVCNGRGVCSDFDTCSCFSSSGIKITGDSCENLLCQGNVNGVDGYYAQTDARVCSKHGKCSFNSTNLTGGCSCEANYYGEKCELFNCYSISKNNANVCSSHGQCTNVDTCQCYNDDSNGHYYGSTCSSCHPAYKGSNCQERTCSGSTCKNGGSCGADYQCICTGNFTGIVCDSCKSDLYGADCNVYCNEKSTCNGQGSCNANGQCVCYADREHGYWNGINCNICLNGYYGNDCNTYFASFNSTVNSNSLFGQVSKYFDGISFKLFGSPSYLSNTLSCSKLIHPSDLPIVGSEPKCSWTNKLNGDFKISFDTDFTLDVSITTSIRLNSLVFSSLIPNYIGLSIVLANDIQAPIANIKTLKKIYSTSESLYFSGANSFSGDKKGLEYYWSIGGGSAIPVDLLQSITSTKGPSLKIEKWQLAIGSYSINLYVKSQVSRLVSGTESVVVQVQDTELPSVSISGNKELNVKSTDKNIIIKKSTSIPTSLKDKEMKIEWMQMDGPLVQYKKDTFNNLIIEQLANGQIKYVFKVSITLVENPTLTASDFVVLNAEQPQLLLSLALKQAIANSSYSIQVNFQDPENNSAEKEVWRWTCMDSDTLGYCGDAVVEKMSVFAKNRSNILIVSPKDFTTVLKPTLTLNIQKGDRSVSSSIALNIAHSPPIISIINISPKMRNIVNNNDKISIEAKHSDSDVSDPSLYVKTMWKIDSTLISESDTVRDDNNNNDFTTSSNSVVSPFANLKIVNKNQQTSIIVDAKELEDGIDHSIQLKVSFMKKNEQVAFTESINTFKKAAAPRKCPCSISPPSGISMQTDFVFTCDNCQNEENTIIVKQGYIDKDTGIKVYIPLSKDNSVKLPSSSSGSNIISLFIELNDFVSGESRIMYSNVTVTTVLAKSLLEIVNQVSNQTSSILSSSVVDGDTAVSMADTINTIVSVSQSLKALSTLKRVLDQDVVSSVQTKLLDTLSSSLKTSSDISPSTSSMAVFAIHALVNSGDSVSLSVIEKSTRVLTNVVEMIIISKVDIFTETRTLLSGVIGTLSSKIEGVIDFRDQFEKLEAISVIAEQSVLSYVNFLPLSAEASSLHKSSSNVKADRLYLSDFSETLIASSPTSSARGVTYQAYVRIPPFELTETTEYSEVTYSLLMKDHVPLTYQKILTLNSTSPLKVVSPASASFSIVSSTYPLDLQNITIHMSIDQQEYSSTLNLTAYSCVLINSDLQLDRYNCTVSGRETSTNSIKCNCRLTNLKISNLIILKDTSLKDETLQQSTALLRDDIIIAIAVVIPSVTILVVAIICIIVIVIVWCLIKKRKGKVHPTMKTPREMVSHDIEKPQKIADSVTPISQF